MNCDSFKKEIQTEKDRADILTFEINDLKNENKELNIKMNAIEEKTLLTEKKFKAQVEKQTTDLKSQYEKKRKALEKNGQEYVAKLENKLKSQKDIFERKLRESNDKNKKEQINFEKSIGRSGEVL